MLGPDLFLFSPVGSGGGARQRGLFGAVVALGRPLPSAVLFLAVSLSLVECVILKRDLSGRIPMGNPPRWRTSPDSPGLLDSAFPPILRSPVIPCLETEASVPCGCGRRVHEDETPSGIDLPSAATVRRPEAVGPVCLCGPTPDFPESVEFPELESFGGPWQMSLPP